MRPYLLHHGFEAMAAAHPHRPAVADASGRAPIDYAGLEADSRALALRLRGGGLHAGDRVGVWMHKSAAAVAALLAILRAGGVYVPCDPQAPPARVGQLLGDAGIRFLIADAALLHAAGGQLGGGWPTLPGPADGRWNAAATLPELPPAAVTSEDLAYILYTSGSTGSPKGVMLTHAHALNFIHWAIDEFALGPTDRVANHAPFHFDLSIFDLWAALSCGAQVCLLDRVTASFPAAVADWIGAWGISVWYSVPSALQKLAPLLGEGAAGACPRRFASLRWVLFAGELMPAPALRIWRDRLPHAGFANLYGPTETNVCAFYRLPAAPAPIPDPLPIGRACPNFVLEILDERQCPVPAGEVGYLWARGPGVFAGYWGDAARTVDCQRGRDGASAAVPAGHPRLYNTGDRAHLGRDGELYFHGRCDDLVKCRGYRISLSEVQAVLLACPGVRQAAVLAQPDRRKTEWLHAVVAGDAALLDPARIRAACAAKLPPYMIPEQIDIQSQLPETSTGKLDRVRLLAELEGRRRATCPSNSRGSAA